MNSQQLRERLINCGLANVNSIQGCSESELNQIVLAAGRSLPRDYREFMSGFGKQAGRFLRDLDIFFPTVLTLKTIAIEILRDYEEYNLSLPIDAFVFAMRNKEQFMFYSHDNDDPPIMFYMSGDHVISKIADSLWDVIEAELRQAEHAYSQIKGTPYDLRSNEKNG